MGRRVSKWEYAFRAGRGEPVELADEHVDEATLEQLTTPGGAADAGSSPAASAVEPAVPAPVPASQAAAAAPASSSKPGQRSR